MYTKQTGHCNTFNDFIACMNSFIEASSTDSLEINVLCCFLKANKEYLNSRQTLDVHTAQKLTEFVQRISAGLDKNSSEYKTLKKIDKLTIGSVKQPKVDVVDMELDRETSTAADDISRLRSFLSSRLQGNEGIQQAIQLLRNDRFTGGARMKDFLMETLGQLPVVDDTLIQDDPLFAMLILILNDNPAEDELRDAAVDAYIAQYPNDKRFERAYVYLKTPHILLAHLLIVTNQWRCANPDNKEFYDEQMAGLFHGTIAFDNGDRISFEEYAMIQQREGENPQYPIGKKLEMNVSGYEVIGWCSTPAMCITESRIDDLFIASRRMLQEGMLTGFVDRLMDTSEIVQRVYSLPQNEKTIVAIIGPYCAGKSEFVKMKFASENEITVYSLDRLNELLRKPSSRPQDHHFEAMMLTSKLLKQIAQVPVLLTEAAAIDEWRFNRFVGRDFSSRDRILIEEIAPESIDVAVRRFVEREGEAVAADQTRVGAVTTSATDALKFRSGRIQAAVANPKIDYTLYLSMTITDGVAVFQEIAKVKNGTLTVTEGRDDAFGQLVPAPQPKE